MPDDLASFSLSVLAGLGLGAFFFVTLFWTIRKALMSPRPWLWFVASLVARFAIVLTGFYVVAGSSWPRLIGCAFGFFVARSVAKRLAVTVGARHAP